MPGQAVHFTSAAGHRLAGRLDLPAGPVRACALFAHCFSCGKDVIAAVRIGQALARHGIAMLRFDFTGIGVSEGDFSDTNFSSNVADLLAAAGFLRTQYAAPQLLIGHSLGGTAALAAAPGMPEVRAVATIAALSEPRHVTGVFREHLDGIVSQGQARVQLAGRPFTIKRQFIEDAARHQLGHAIRDLGRALLVLHSPLDDTVDVSNAFQIFQAARHPKSFVSLDDANHLLTQRNDALYVADLIAAWASRYLDLAPVAP